MAIDVYEPCPCGSGKKLKFCCAAIIDDMAKVARFHSNEQPRLALQILEKLEKSHADNPWVVTTHADILLGLNEAGAAKERLEAFLKICPDDPPALAHLALATLLAQGYDAARPAIHRAFQKCIAHHPRNAGLLALSVATIMVEGHHEMAARQYLSFAIRLLANESREEVFTFLLKLDGDTEIFYPLRSVHNLSPYPAGGPHAADAAKAAAWANIGCWGPAGRAFARIAELEPQNAAVWFNAGLCRAWDAEEAAAAEAFHRAAQAAADFEFAVECETLAQLCDLRTTDKYVPTVAFRYEIRSASRLLGRLDGSDRISPLPAHDEREDDLPIAGEFVIRDKPLPAETDPSRLTIEQIPITTANLVVLDGDPQEAREAAAILQGHLGEGLSAARDLFERLGEDEIVGAPSPLESARHDGVPLEHLPFLQSFQFPANLPLTVRRALLDAQWKHLLDDVWMTGPQAGLNGKSPAELQGDPSQRVRLTAAAYVLDALAQRLGRTLDLDSLLGRLGLEPLRPIEPKDELPLSALSPMQLHRLSVPQLSDSQLVHAHRRALLIGHRRFVDEVSREVLARPQVLAQVDSDRIYRTLVSIARDEGRLQDAIRWTLEAKERAATHGNAFELVLSWTISEFWLRLEGSLDDPALPALYRHLNDYYAPKVPQIGPVLEMVREKYGDRCPWMQSSGILVESGAGAGGGGLWTPGGSAAPAPGGGKLWLPGQE